MRKFRLASIVIGLVFAACARGFAQVAPAHPSAAAANAAPSSRAAPPTAATAHAAPSAGGEASPAQHEHEAGCDHASCPMHGDHPMHADGDMHGPGPMHGPGHGPEGGEHEAMLLAHLADVVELSAPLRKKVDELVYEAEKRAIGLRADAERAGLELHHALDQDVPDADVVLKQLDKVGQLETELRKLWMKARLDAGKLLTPEQRERLRHFAHGEFGMQHHDEHAEHGHMEHEHGHMEH
jgi:Spy/CpxP family protein refolding chaperone